MQAAKRCEGAQRYIEVPPNCGTIGSVGDSLYCTCKRDREVGVALSKQKRTDLYRVAMLFVDEVLRGENRSLQLLLEY